MRIACWIKGSSWSAVRLTLHVAVRTSKQMPKKCCRHIACQLEFGGWYDFNFMLHDLTFWKKRTSFVSFPFFKFGGFVTGQWSRNEIVTLSSSFTNAYRRESKQEHALLVMACALNAATVKETAGSIGVINTEHSSCISNVNIIISMIPRYQWLSSHVFSFPF